MKQAQTDVGVSKLTYPSHFLRILLKLVAAHLSEDTCAAAYSIIWTTGSFQGPQANYYKQTKQRQSFGYSHCFLNPIDISILRPGCCQRYYHTVVQQDILTLGTVVARQAPGLLSELSEPLNFKFAVSLIIYKQHFNFF